jgi:bifunctional non-homologous end joining protein LigD
LEGEIICLDGHGISHFNDLMDRKSEPILCAFDLLWLDGPDLQRLTLIERKNRFHKLIQSGACGRILYAQHIEHRGKEFFQANDGNSWLSPGSGGKRH